MESYEHTFKRYTIKEEDQKRLDNNFVFHPVKVDEMQSHRYEAIRQELRDVAELLYQFCPPSRELSLAITKLEEAMFWANSSIARNE